MYNVIKLQAPFERIKQYNCSPDISLRKAIITQAIVDATNVSDGREGKKIATEAREWLFGNSDSFIETCSEAGMEASYVVRIAKEAMKLHKSQIKIKQEKRSILIDTNIKSVV